MPAPAAARVAAVALALLALGACAWPPDASRPSGEEAERAGASAPGGPAPLLGPPRQLTFAGRRTGEGYFGPHGRQLVFQSEREAGNPFYQIYRLDLATGAEERVSPGTGKTTCAWIHPDGRSVLFASTHLDPDAVAKQAAELERRAAGREQRYAWDYDEQYELFVRDGATGELRRLTRAKGYDAEASFSPDGRRIVFASNRAAFADAPDAADRELLGRDPSRFVDLYVMDADGTGVRRLTRAPGYDGGPFFSPDGRRIVWRRFALDGATAEIFTMPAAGGDGRPVTQVTRLGAMSWAPFWHPSGDYLVFATNVHGFANFELYLVDALGRHAPVRVTELEGFDGLPAFSPDGATLAWTRRPPGAAGSQIFAADWSDAAARRLLGLAPRDDGDPTPASRTAPPDTTAVRAHVTALASDAMEGRLTGTEGERLATRYVADAFAELDLEPAGEDGGWFQPFSFTAGVSLGPRNRLAAVTDGRERGFEPDRDWRPLAFSRDGAVPPSEVVFAGYGLVVPAGEDGDGEALDDYAGLDVEGRWVLALRYLPEDLPPERRQRLHRYASLRYKAMLARDRGARGILFASGPRSRFERELVALRFDGALAGASLAALSVSDETADALLAGTGRRLGDLQAALDRGPSIGLGAVPGLRLAARVDLVRERRTGRNVLARLPAPGGGADEPLVVGAHVDHLGHGGGTSSLARDDERGLVHYGADDNASGVAALLEVARQLRTAVENGGLRPARDVLFAAWSGEELGLLGSSHFLAQAAAPGETGPHGEVPVAAYLNMDMVGRLRGEALVYGTATSPAWPLEVERAAAPGRLRLALRDDGLLPTDATPFVLHGVPMLSVFTGAHAEYHTPRDTVATLDLAGVARIAGFVGRLAAELAADPDAPGFTPPVGPGEGPPRAGLRVYLGTIPDYAAEGVDGLRLQGVMQGGPAERAGLRAGDVVVGVAGRRVENLYDYTYALDALRVGEPVEFEIVRDGERRTLSVVPGSRE